MKSKPRRRPREKPQPPPDLDPGKIVQAALTLLDEVGFDGLTMRGLADKLGIKAASLYWHIRSKQELLSLMANEICAALQAPDPSLPWQLQLEALGNEYRGALLSHRDAARVLAATGAPSGPNLLRLTELVLRSLLAAGFNARDAVYAGSLLNDYVVMSVLEETRFAATQAENAAASSPSGSASWFGELPASEYLSLVALAGHLVEFDADDRFRFGSDVLIHGLEARLLSKA